MKDELAAIKAAATERKTQEAEEARAAEEEKLRRDSELQGQYSEKFNKVLENIENSTDSLLEARKMLKDETLTEDEKSAIEQIIENKEKEISEGQEEVENIGAELESRGVKPKEVEQLEKDLDQAVEKADAKGEEESRLNELKESAEKLDAEIKTAINDLLREVSKYGHLASASEMLGLSDTDTNSYIRTLAITPKLDDIEKTASRITEAKNGLGLLQLNKKKELGALIKDLGELHAKVEEQRNFISEKLQGLKSLVKEGEGEINRMLRDRRSLDDQAYKASPRGYADLDWQATNKTLEGLYNEVLADEFSGEYQYYVDTFTAVRGAKEQGMKFDENPTDESLNPPYSYDQAKEMQNKMNEIKARYSRIKNS